MPNSSTILLVDDEDSVQTLLTYPLGRDGHRVIQARDGERPRRFGEDSFDLVVLDVMLPRLDGLEVCKRLRSQSNVPIIMLTARGEEARQGSRASARADDYITKPFSIREFRSRVRALLRRLQSRTRAASARSSSSAGELRIDVPRRTVEVRGEPVQLTFIEFEMLAVLASSRRRILTPRAPRAPARRRRLPGAPHDRRPCSPSAREGRARSERSRADPHDSRRRVWLRAG